VNYQIRTDGPVSEVLQVRVSRSPPCQPSASVAVRSATRPERSTWASPYTTSRPSADGRTGGTVSGKVRAAAGARAGRAAAEEGMTGAISVPVTAAPAAGGGTGQRRGEAAGISRAVRVFKRCSKG